MWVYFVIAIVVLIFIIFLIFNSFVKWKNKVNEAFSTMDVYLKKRWDLIPNLVEVVKGYAKHEAETFESVIRVRNNAYDSMSFENKLKTNEQLTNDLNKIMILTENYPELKASTQFQNLSKELTQVEDEIANARKYYNATVRIYNNKIQVFPNLLFAGIFGFKSIPYFLTSSDERENVKVEL